MAPQPVLLPATPSPAKGRRISAPLERSPETATALAPDRPDRPFRPDRATRSKPRDRGWRGVRRRLRNWIVPLLAPLAVRVVFRSIRIRWCGPGLSCPGPRGETSCIYVLWHQRLLGLVYSHRNTNARTLISQHADGDLIAGIVERLGFKPIRGSSSRGGIRALRELIASGGDGFDYGIVPDGPRGPCFEFKPGALFLASQTGFPIVPITISFARAWRARSWDRFLVPKPFTRAVIHVGEPVHIPGELGDGDIASWQRELGTRLKAITEETDEQFEKKFRDGVKFSVRRRSPER